MDKIDNFTRGYITAALWSSNDSTPDGGEFLDQNYDQSDLAPETLHAMIEDCKRFQAENAADIELACQEYPQNHHDGTPLDFAGHDFWLTRNGHGSGYFDGDLSDELGKRLTKACESYKEVTLYVGDDGRIYS